MLIPNCLNSAVAINTFIAQTKALNFCKITEKWSVAPVLWQTFKQETPFAKVCTSQLLFRQQQRHKYLLQQITETKHKIVETKKLREINTSPLWYLLYRQ